MESVPELDIVVYAVSHFVFNESVFRIDMSLNEFHGSQRLAFAPTSPC